MNQSYTMHGASQWANLGSRAIAQELWAAYGNPSDPTKPRITRIENVEDQPLYQKKDIDLLVHSYRPRTMDMSTSSIEVKADTYPAGDFPDKKDQGNFFFELVSNDTRKPRSPGCFVYCEADHFYYLFAATGTLYTFDCKALQACVLKRIGFDKERFLNDPRSLTEVKMRGLKHTATRIGGVVRYRTWGVALPIAQVLQWAHEDGVKVQKRNMFEQVHQAAKQMGMEAALLDKAPKAIVEQARRRRQEMSGPIAVGASQSLEAPAVASASEIVVAREPAREKHGNENRHGKALPLFEARPYSPRQTNPYGVSVAA